MKIDLEKGLLKEAKFVRSDHCDERPNPIQIDMIVIHGISLPPNQFATHFIEDFFCGVLDKNAHPYFEEICSQRVSSHLLIDRQGNVTQFVPFHKRAWHAGKSFFQGQTQCNDFSIGIELIGADDIAYEHSQYQALSEIINALKKAYPTISSERIVGHSDIASGRKTDPGPSFDWNYLNSLLLP